MLIWFIRCEDSPAFEKLLFYADGLAKSQRVVAYPACTFWTPTVIYAVKLIR